MQVESADARPRIHVLAIVGLARAVAVQSCESSCIKLLTIIERAANMPAIWGIAPIARHPCEARHATWAAIGVILLKSTIAGTVARILAAISLAIDSIFLRG